MSILVVKLKAIKSKKNSFYYLSSYSPNLSSQAACLQIYLSSTKTQFAQASDPRSVSTILTVPYLLSLSLATRCLSPQATSEWPTSLTIVLRQLGQFIYQGAVLVASNKLYFFYPHDGSIGLELCVDQRYFFTTPQATNLARKWINERVISSQL